jgi:hypothetical protein
MHMHLFLLSTLIYRLLIVLINVSLLSTPHAFKCTCFDQRIFTIYTNIIQALNCLDQRIFTVSTKIEALNCLDHRIFTATHEDTGSELSRSTYLYCPHEDRGSELSRSSYLYCPHEDRGGGKFLPRAPVHCEVLEIILHYYVWNEL